MVVGDPFRIISSISVSNLFRCSRSSETYSGAFPSQIYATLDVPSILPRRLREDQQRATQKIWYLGSYSLIIMDEPIADCYIYTTGPVVRVAPGQYSIDSVDAAKTIYGHGSHFAKVTSTSIRDQASNRLIDCFFRMIGTSHGATPPRTTSSTS